MLTAGPLKRISVPSKVQADPKVTAAVELSVIGVPAVTNEPLCVTGLLPPIEIAPFSAASTPVFPKLPVIVSAPFSCYIVHY